MRKKIHFGLAEGVFTYDTFSQIMRKLGAETVSFGELFSGKEIVYQLPNDVVVLYGESPGGVTLSKTYLHSQSPDAESKIGEIEKIILDAQSDLEDKTQEGDSK